jgi:hypothetical protein
MRFSRVLRGVRCGLVAAGVMLTSAVAGAAPRNLVLAAESGPMGAHLEVTASTADGCEARLLQPVPQAGDSLAAAPCHGFVAVGVGQSVTARARVNASRNLAGLPGASSLPAPVVTLEPPITMLGLRVQPFTVDARLDDATLATDLSLSFAFAGAPDLPTVVPESFDRIFGSLVLNWDGLRDQVEVGPGTYVVIMPSDPQVSTAVQPLLTWRKRQGYNVIAVTTAVTGAAAPQIKAYLQNLYDTVQPPLEYVCLVGDANGAVPVATWYETLSGYGGEGDHYYTTLAGSDIVGDVHVGRLSVRTPAELSTVVSKILSYETNPPTAADPAWFRRATLAGDPGASGITTVYCQQWVRAQLERVGYTECDTIYSDPFASRMFNYCNLGCTAFAYRGYWGVSGFNQGYIDALHNGGELPFAVLPTCGSGSFASESHAYTEAFLRNPNGGAIGAIGTATTGTHTRFNNCFFSGVWEGIINSGDRHLGAAQTRGKLELYNNFNTNEANAVEIWSVWDNLMGDPATEMWQALPRTLTVAFPGQLPVGANAVPLLVQHLGVPVAGARVALTKGTEVRSTGYTGADGRVTLPLPGGLSAGALFVAVTGPDLMPYQGSLSLGTVDAFASVSGYQVADGQANAGETVGLTIALSNLGSQTIESLSAVVVSDDARVQVTGGPASFGNLAAGATAWGGPVTLHVDAAAPDGLRVPLRVTASSGSLSWVSQIEVPIVAARPVVQTAAWVQDTGGNPLGEIRTLRVTLRNDGGRPATGVRAVLTSRHRYLTPAGTNDVAVGALAVGATGGASFLVDLNPLAEGQLVALSLAVTTAEGSRHDLEFAIPIGTSGDSSPSGPDGFGYMCFDNGDPYPEAPTYAWVEIDPNYFGQGTSVGLTDYGYEQDDTQTVPLPFTFRYYGEAYTSLAICSNGWVALGATTLRPYHNLALPSANSPNAMLAIFWDDLYQTGSNRVYRRYDAANGRYIVQWSRMPNDNGGVQNCEIILYDPAVHPTATGDGLIVMQYAAVDDNDYDRAYSTTGIQNPDHTDGLTYSYYNTYAPGARTLQAGRAIAFVPMPRLGASGLVADPAQLNVVMAPGTQESTTLDLAAGGAAGTFASYTATAGNHLGVTPATGVVAAGQSSPLTVSIDATTLAEGTYQLSLTITSTAGAPLVVPVHLTVTTSTAVDDPLPRAVALSPAMPNPFNPRTELSFALPAPGPVRLTIHDLAGRCVATLVDETRPAGFHHVTWEGTGTHGERLASGTYLARMVAGGEVKTVKLTMVK